MNDDGPGDRRDPTERSARERLRGVAGGETRDRLRRRTRAGEGSQEASAKPPRRARGEDEPGAATDYTRVKGRLQRRLLDEITERHLTGDQLDEIDVAVAEFVDRVLSTEHIPLNRDERERLADELKEETIGVGPLATLMADPAVTDILVNGPERVWVERFGRLEPTGVRFRDAEHVVRVIERIAARLGRRIDASRPMLDARLPDGSRVNATLPPVSIDGPTISIRRFGERRLRRRDLKAVRMFDDGIELFLDHAVHARQNVLVSGGTGAGKSTLLGALCEAISGRERVITIEDTAELILDQEHVVRLETRPPNLEGQGTVTARDLVINSLRMRPDRIIVGEVRGGEALDMLQAMNTGHDGGLCTIHANSPRDALSRLETMVLMAGLDLPSRAIREQIASAIQVIVHVRRYEDGVRRVERVCELVGLEGQTVTLNDIFRFEREGMRERRVTGRHRPSGVVPRLVEELRLRGVDLPTSIFRRAAEERDG